jgi:hypothetical protein
MTHFIYPLKIQTPTTNPFDEDDINWKFWTKRFWKCLFQICDPIQWEEPIKTMLNHYNIILKKKGDQYYLPKNTILYHGSTNYPFFDKTFLSNKITFFGLDIVIALWYILEEIYNKNDHCVNNQNVKINGYLYEFQLTKDLPITHIIKKLIINPKDRTEPCKKIMNAVCLHPQISFHGTSFTNHYRDIVPMFDLCNEITLRYTVYKDYMHLKNVYFVDPFILHKNATKIHFDPVKSIVSNKKYKDIIGCQEYKKEFKFK